MLTVFYRLFDKIVDVIYQAWDVVFHHEMNHREKSWKDAQQSVFNELQGVKSLCRMLDRVLILPLKRKWF